MSHSFLLFAVLFFAIASMAYRSTRPSRKWRRMEAEKDRRLLRDAAQRFSSQQ
jgi:hypothetical protein